MVRIPGILPQIDPNIALFQVSEIIIRIYPEYIYVYIIYIYIIWESLYNFLTIPDVSSWTY